MFKGLATQATLLMAALLATTAAQAGDIEVPRAGYTLQAQQQGEGTTVVVFESGFGQGASVWKDVIADLGAECRCVAYARAGLGKSGTDGKAKTIEEHLQDLGAVIDALAPDRNVVLVGHSYSGMLVTEAGGVVTDFSGGQRWFERGNIVGAAPGVHRELMEIIARHVTEEQLDHKRKG